MWGAKLATMMTVSIKRDIEQAEVDKENRSVCPEREKPDKAADDRLLDDLLGAPIQRKTRIPKPCGGKRRRNPVLRLPPSKAEPPREYC